MKSPDRSVDPRLPFGTETRRPFAPAMLWGAAYFACLAALVWLAATQVGYK